ncbi:hypothetical protein RYJ27_08790 [Microbacterium limosum]|uniref:Glycosyltransferase family 1 protein n=1 Tax=Microbacterium limosum TaxID=3079935 RepID=A0AAU0MF53_9MICO|nr:hypothetical protein [Microbacterium sp. Y20]WOQ68805.1 hypothetical protein RYJ27_08790 [Microbacterium sp. Y20]
MLLFRRPSRRSLVFVVEPRFAESGTSVMRGQQLSEIAQSSGLSSRTISCAPVDPSIRRSDIFLTKGVMKTGDLDLWKRWRRQGNRLFLDPVDEGINDALIDAVDVVVAASMSAYDAYRTEFPRADIRLLNHHVDPRVAEALQRHSDKPLQTGIGYFGEPVNTVRTDRIADHVTFVPVSTARQDTGWLESIAAFDMHYAIRRPRALDHHKPFLKGFTAAACGANILIQRGQPEAARWLPPEYPFWVETDPDEAAILRAIEQAEASRGGPEWRAGLDAMRSIASRTSPAAIGSELEALFS